MKNTAVKSALLAGLTAVTLAGCSVAAPSSDQVVLHYSGGAFSSQNFIECLAPGELAYDGPGDYHFYYPAGQRTFTFSDAEGADAPPIRVSTRNQTELIVRGTVTFTLNPDCTPYTDATGKQWPGGKLQKFHDTIGRQVTAYAEDGGVAQPGGWATALKLYVGGPAERAMDQAGLGYDWQKLYSDVATKNEWTDQVEKMLPELIRAQAGDDLFLINNIQLDKPDVPDTLRAELENNQAATLRQQTAQTDQRAATEFPGGLAAYQEYQRQQAITKAITEGKVNPLIIPQGSPIIAGGAR